MSEYLTKLFLKRRGYSQQVLRDLDDGQHDQLKNIDKMADILKHVHDVQQQIVVMPDFDCDGITAGTLGFAGLAELGFNAGLYMPDETKGYGIHVSDIDTLLERFPNVKYIITCDVGITCYDAFEYAYQKGIKVLITDHHEEKIDKPKPLCQETIVNPCQLNETYKLRDICGAHVLWQVLSYYTKKYADDFAMQQISRLCVFAGIGTEGDSMPIVKENRQLLKSTISLLRFIYNCGNNDIVNSIPGCNVYKRVFIGLFDLIKVLDKTDKLRGEIDEEFLAFYVVPVFNSIKRMELPMTLAFGTFFADSKTQLTYAQKMVEANNQRKEKTAEYDQTLQTEIANGQQPYAPYLFTTDAPAGLIGLIAQKEINRTNRPTFVINKQGLNGSGRTPEWFQALDLLPDTPDYQLAGHQCAFGISFNNQNHLADFKQKIMQLEQTYKPQMQSQKRDYDVALASNLYDKSAVKFDEVLNLDDCWDFYQDTQNLRPFGVGFNKPVVKIIFDTKSVEFRLMGKQQEHLKVILPNKMELIAWNKAEDLAKLKQHKLNSFYGYFSVNSFRGKISLQMIGDFKDAA